MGKLKKTGVNEKAAEAKQSKDAKKAAHKVASETASEDAEWAAAGEGKQSKGGSPRPHPYRHRFIHSLYRRILQWHACRAGA